MPYVKKLEGKNNIKRKQIIIDILSKSGFNYKLEEYNYFSYRGENIIITFGKGSKEILVVTHYDVVKGSPGANDNASTIAVVFDVIKKLKNYKAKNKIKFIIFGDEEKDCIGSKAYVRKHGTKNIIAVYNMELVGMGDMIGIWPVTKDVLKSKALLNLRKTIKKLGYYYEESGKLPLFFGDYKPFRRAGIKDSFCISVIPKKDRKAIREFVETPNYLITLKLMFNLLKIPKMFQLYHSSEDKSKYLNESALRMTSDVLYNAVISMDKNS